MQRIIAVRDLVTIFAIYFVIIATLLYKAEN